MKRSRGVEGKGASQEPPLASALRLRPAQTTQPRGGGAGNGGATRATATAAAAAELLKTRSDIIECRVIEGRGRALVATAAVKKGETFSPSDPWRLCRRSPTARVSWRARTVSHQPEMNDHHLALASGNVTRRDHIAAAATNNRQQQQQQQQQQQHSRLRLPSIPSLPSSCDGDSGGSDDKGGTGGNGA